MNRRNFIIGATTAISAPMIWVPNLRAQASGKRRELLSQAKSDLVNSAAMTRHLNEIQNDVSVEGISPESFNTATSVMENQFPDKTDAAVYGVDGHATFSQSTRDKRNDCGAYMLQNSVNTGCCDETMARLKNTECVTLLEGPTIIALGEISKTLKTEFSRNFAQRQSSKLVQQHCLPVFAGTRAYITFETINQQRNVDIIQCGAADTAIKYQFLQGRRDKAEARYSMVSRETKETIFEGSFVYETGA